MPARTLRGLAAAALAASVAACGGSGGSGAAGSTAASDTGSVAGSVGTITVFPLQAAYKGFVSNGYIQQFGVGGDCAGTATQQSAKPVAASFAGTAALAVVSGSDFSLPGCNASIVGSAGVQYFDASYRALGASSPGGGFGRYDTPLTMPAFVSAGDSGPLGIQRLYADSAGAVPAGKTVITYSILPDTAATVLTRFVTQAYNTADQLLVTQTSTYRLGANGSFAVAEVDIRYPNNGLHLVLTPSAP